MQGGMFVIHFSRPVPGYNGKHQYGDERHFVGWGKNLQAAVTHQVYGGRSRMAQVAREHHLWGSVGVLMPGAFSADLRASIVELGPHSFCFACRGSDDVVLTELDDVDAMGAINEAIRRLATYEGSDACLNGLRDQMRPGWVPTRDEACHVLDVLLAEAGTEAERERI